MRSPRRGRSATGPMVTALRLLGTCLLVVYLFVLARSALRPQTGTTLGVIDNWVPLYSIRRTAREAVDLSVLVRQVGGNLVLLAPLGVYVGAWRLRRSSAAILLVGASVAIEVTQGWFIRGRSFDVDDLILNAIGAAVGYTVGRVLCAIAHSLDAKVRRSEETPRCRSSWLHRRPRHCVDRCCPPGSPSSLGVEDLRSGP